LFRSTRLRCVAAMAPCASSAAVQRVSLCLDCIIRSFDYDFRVVFPFFNGSFRPRGCCANSRHDRRIIFRPKSYTTPEENIGLAVRSYTVVDRPPTAQPNLYILLISHDGNNDKYVIIIIIIDRMMYSDRVVCHVSRTDSNGHATVTVVSPVGTRYIPI